MTRDEAITVFKVFIENPLFSDVHKAAFNIAIHDIQQRHDWDINNLMLVPRSEWEQDHEILKAYSDGANEVLDKIRAEIKKLDIFYDSDHFSSDKDAMFKCNDVLQILEKYEGGSED